MNTICNILDRFGLYLNKAPKKINITSILLFIYHNLNQVTPMRNIILLFAIHTLAIKTNAQVNLAQPFKIAKYRGVSPYMILRKENGFPAI